MLTADLWDLNNTNFHELGRTCLPVGRLTRMKIENKKPETEDQRLKFLFILIYLLTDRVEHILADSYMLSETNSTLPNLDKILGRILFISK